MKKSRDVVEKNKRLPVARVQNSTRKTTKSSKKSVGGASGASVLQPVSRSSSKTISSVTNSQAENVQTEKLCSSNEEIMKNNSLLSNLDHRVKKQDQRLKTEIKFRSCSSESWSTPKRRKTKVPDEVRVSGFMQYAQHPTKFESSYNTYIWVFILDSALPL